MVLSVWWSSLRHLEDLLCPATYFSCGAPHKTYFVQWHNNFATRPSSARNPRSNSFEGTVESADLSGRGRRAPTHDRAGRSGRGRRAPTHDRAGRVRMPSAGAGGEMALLAPAHPGVAFRPSSGPAWTCPRPDLAPPSLPPPGKAEPGNVRLPRSGRVRAAFASPFHRASGFARRVDGIRGRQAVRNSTTRDVGGAVECLSAAPVSEAPAGDKQQPAHSAGLLKHEISGTKCPAVEPSAISARRSQSRRQLFPEISGTSARSSMPKAQQRALPARNFGK